MIEILFFLVFIAGIGVGSVVTAHHVRRPLNKTIADIQQIQLNIRREELQRRQIMLVDENYRRTLNG